MLIIIIQQSCTCAVATGQHTKQTIGYFIKPHRRHHTEQL